MKVKWIGKEKISPKYGRLTHGLILEVSEALAKQWIDAKLCIQFKVTPKLNEE